MRTKAALLTAAPADGRRCEPSRRARPGAAPRGPSSRRRPSVSRFQIGHGGLERVDAEPGRLERLAPVRGGGHHHHGRLAERHRADPVDQRPCGPARASGAGPRPRSGRMRGSACVLVGLVLEAGDALPVAGVVADRAAERHDRAAVATAPPRPRPASTGSGLGRRARPSSSPCGRGGRHGGHRRRPITLGPPATDRPGRRAPGPRSPRIGPSSVSLRPCRSTTTRTTDPELGPPPPPDDRLWRHPSEIGRRSQPDPHRHHAAPAAQPQRRPSAWSRVCSAPPPCWPCWCRSAPSTAITDHRGRRSRCKQPLPTTSDQPGAGGHGQGAARAGPGRRHHAERHDQRHGASCSATTATS